MDVRVKFDGECSDSMVLDFAKSIGKKLSAL